jgi:hypothetical protein
MCWCGQKIKFRVIASKLCDEAIPELLAAGCNVTRIIGFPSLPLRSGFTLQLLARKSLAARFPLQSLTQQPLTQRVYLHNSLLDICTTKILHFVQNDKWY